MSTANLENQITDRAVPEASRAMGRAGLLSRRSVILYFTGLPELHFCSFFLYIMDLHTNASKVVELDAKIKKLSEQFAALKVELMSQMVADNVSEIVIKRKKVIVCHRQNKDFGAEIAAAELQIKAEKKKLETLGEFTISSVTNFIQVR